MTRPPQPRHCPPGLALGLLLLATPVAAAGEVGREPAAALAFVRVFGDARVEFTQEARPPIALKDRELGTGSGFAIAPSGLVLTNLHVVRPEPAPGSVQGKEVRLTFDTRRVEVVVGSGTGRRAFEGSLAASDADADLAVLQVVASDLPYLAFGDSDAVEPGRPVKVLGFPFGREVEVGKPPGPHVVPEPTITVGSLSAAREDEEGKTRYLQTDASVQPGSSGGPILDEDGYVIGVVRMKLSAGAAAGGAGFGVPINLVKDFLDANGLLTQLPSARLRPGVVNSFDWKGLRLELPDGFQDGSTARLLVESEPLEGISLRVERVSTSWTVTTLEQALLGGRALPAFAPAPANPGRRFEGQQTQRAILSATGTGPDGGAFRVDYVLVSRPGETVVARYLGPPDSIAFNLGLLHRSLASLEVEPLLTGVVRAPVGVALEPAASPDAAGNRVPVPVGWAVEPSASCACPGLPPAEEGVVASPPGDFTVVLRMLRWERQRSAAERASRACGSGEGYSRRFSRLGVAMGASGILVPRADGLLLLEVEAPEAKLPLVRDLFDAWARRLEGKSARND